MQSWYFLENDCGGAIMYIFIGKCCDQIRMPAPTF